MPFIESQDSIFTDSSLSSHQTDDRYSILYAFTEFLFNRIKVVVCTFQPVETQPNEDRGPNFVRRYEFFDRKDR
jgi:hypothetical protein